MKQGNALDYLLILKLEALDPYPSTRNYAVLMPERPHTRKSYSYIVITVPHCLKALHKGPPVPFLPMSESCRVMARGRAFCVYWPIPVRTRKPISNTKDLG